MDPSAPSTPFVPTRRRVVATLAAFGLLPSAACAPDPGRIDRPTDPVAETARRVVAGLTTPRDRAVALFGFVRDRVRFGFTAAFDQAPPERTLEAGLGHCNPQGNLFATLLNAVDIQARQRFMTIDRAVLHGLFPEGVGPGQRIQHSIVEVRLDGAWIPVDGYIADRPLFDGARRRLKSEGRRLGYGVHAAGSIDWDGRSPCMSQLADPAMVLEDHGAWTEPAAFYETAAYTQDIGAFGRLAFSLFVADRVNGVIDGVRAGSA